MERKQYLEIAKAHGMVCWKGGLYRADTYILGFDRYGNTRHSCGLIDFHSNTALTCRLDEVECNTGDSAVKNHA